MALVQRRIADARYFDRYAEIIKGEDIRAEAGWVDGVPAVAMYRLASSAVPAYFVLLEWTGGRITLIRDGLTRFVKRCICVYMTAESIRQLPCACTSMRRATRAVTRLYDRELRETGLRSTQFTLLQALEIAGELTQGELGSLLSLDSTTLTRSLRPLLGAGWVKGWPGADRRERHLRLTPSGLRKYHEAVPGWRRAQNQLKKAVGRGWDELEQGMRRITAAVS